MPPTPPRREVLRSPTHDRTRLAARQQQQQEEEGLLLAQQVARAEAALRRFVLLQWLWFDARCKEYAREVSEVLALPLPALVQPSVL